MIQVHGDAFEDIWVDVDRRGPSREAPIDIMDVKKQVMEPGGARNVFMALTYMSSDLLRDCSAMVQSKIRYTQNGAQIFRSDTPVHLSQAVPRIIPYAKHVIVDYDKGTINQVYINRIMATAPGECYVAVRSPKPYYECLDIRKTTYFCNIDEFDAHAWGHPLGRQMIITDGPRGAIQALVYPYNVIELTETAPSYARNVQSVCGAGDIVVAAWVTQQDLTYAMAAAAVKVEGPRTYIPTLGEVNARYQEIMGNRDRGGQREGLLRKDHGSEARVPMLSALPQQEGRNLLWIGGDGSSGSERIGPGIGARDCYPDSTGYCA